MKNILIGLQNFWKWRKVVYNDRDWDSYFIYEMLKTKLKHTADHFQKYGMRDRDNYDAQTMLHCVSLIEKLQYEECTNEAIKEMVDDKWDKEVILKATEKHNALRKSLFDILEKNIEYWWT